MRIFDRLKYTLGGVRSRALSNDTDPNGDPLVAILDFGVSHGY